MFNEQHTTTDVTVTNDLKAALLKSDLEDHDIAVHRDAERTARLAVNLHDATVYDAALWKAAEGLYGFMDSRSDGMPLRERDTSVRTLYLSMAIRGWNQFRCAMEGVYTPREIAQAHADISNHKVQLGAQVEATRHREAMRNNVRPFARDLNGVMTIEDGGRTA